MRYKLEVWWGEDEFIRRCNKRLRRGWEPVGGVAIVHQADANSAEAQTLYAQAFVRGAP